MKRSTRNRYIWPPTDMYGRKVDSGDFVILQHKGSTFTGYLDDAAFGGVRNPTLSIPDFREWVETQEWCGISLYHPPRLIAPKINLLPLRAYAALRALKNMYPSQGSHSISADLARSVWEKNQPWFDHITKKLAELDGAVSVHEINYTWLEVVFAENQSNVVTVC